MPLLSLFCPEISLFVSTISVCSDMKEKTLAFSAIVIAESGNQGCPKMPTTLPNDL